MNSVQNFDLKTLRDGLREGLRQHSPIQLAEITIVEREPGTYDEYRPDTVRMEVRCKSVDLEPRVPALGGVTFGGFVTVNSPDAELGYEGQGHAIGFAFGRSLAASFGDTPQLPADPPGSVVQKQPRW